MTDEPSFSPYLNPGEAPAKEPAPGAKAGRVCGLLAIVLALTCVGIPIAIILGIVALVKTSKAKNLARRHPEDYELPSNAGLVLGIVGLCLPIVMLPFAGIVSAIAIPALLSQRSHARDKVLIMQWAQVRTRAQVLSMEAQASGGRPLTGDEAIQRLIEDASLKDMKNAYNPGEPVLIRGTEPRSGTIALSPEQEPTEGGTAWSLVMRASFGPSNAQSLREEKIELGTSPEPPQATGQ